MNTNTSLSRLAIAWIILLTVGVQIMARADGPNTPAAARQPSFQELEQNVRQFTLQPATKDNRKYTFDVLSGQLHRVTDAELEKLLNSMQNGAVPTAGFELCLTEIIRRGGNHWEKVLQNRYAEIQRQRQAAGGNLAAAFRLDNVTLPVLTALRRVQKKPDPLTILIAGKSSIHCSLRQLPDLAACLTNLDVEKEPLSIQVGGDYRGSKRHNKWRIEAVDADGHRLPELEDIDMGGLVQFEKLLYAESIPNTLEIRSYVMIDQPGTYTLTVMCRPEFSIANLENVDGLVCCRSIPIILVVEPLTIMTTKAEQSQAANLIQKLPGQGTVKILGGGYTDAMTDFMPKNSPAAQLLQMDWNAVPELIKAVNGTQLNSTQKAWALGLLFSISELRNPMDDVNVVGETEYRHSDRNRDGTVSSPGTGSITGAARNDAAQSQFAKSWKPWIDKGYIKVEYMDGQDVRIIPFH